MIPGALALRGDYTTLTLPVVIIAGEADKVVFKRRSEQLAASIRGGTVRIIKDAGHMVHHFAPRQVAQAIEDVIAACGEPDAPGDDEVTVARKFAWKPKPTSVMVRAEPQRRNLWTNQ